jgi:urease accessory protein
VTASSAWRRDPAWYTPSDLPSEIAAFATPMEGRLDVGAPGKIGLLELTLAPHDGVTRVESQYQRAPLHVYRPIYLDPRLPGMAFVFLQQSGDGLVQGDRYRIDIDCAAGSAVHVTTQAATKVFAARQNFVTQLTNLSAGADAVLEYLPDPVVPFRGSRLFQRTRAVAAPGSTVVLGDVLLPGRVAHDEAHVYDVYWAETEFMRPDGTLLFSDVLRMHPAAGEDPRSIGFLGGHDVLATLYVVTSQVRAAALVSILRSVLACRTSVLAGATELPNGCGVAVRLLGECSAQVQAAMRAAWGAVRVELLDAPPPDLRKG